MWRSIVICLCISGCAHRDRTTSPVAPLLDDKAYHDAERKALLQGILASMQQERFLSEIGVVEMPAWQATLERLLGDAPIDVTDGEQAVFAILTDVRLASGVSVETDGAIGVRFVRLGAGRYPADVLLRVVAEKTHAEVRYERGTPVLAALPETLERRLHETRLTVSFPDGTVADALAEIHRASGMDVLAEGDKRPHRERCSAATGMSPGEQ